MEDLRHRLFAEAVLGASDQPHGEVEAQLPEVPAAQLGMR